METLIVDGPTPLKGEIEVAGAKNSMSKLLTASMLTAEPCEFTNVPAIGDDVGAVSASPRPGGSAGGRR